MVHPLVTIVKVIWWKFAHKCFFVGVKRHDRFDERSRLKDVGAFKIEKDLESSASPCMAQTGLCVQQ